MTTQDTSVPLTRKGQHTRGQIIEAAVTVAARTGLDGLNVSAICVEARLPRSTFYTYFDGIDPLVDAVGAAAADAFAVRFDATHSTLPRGRERLARCLEDVLAMVENDAGLARLVVSLDRTSLELRHRVEAEIAEELKGAGELPGIRPALIASALIGLLGDALDARLPFPATEAVPYLMRLAEPL